MISPPSAYIINIGDLMQRWTNDKYAQRVRLQLRLLLRLLPAEGTAALRDNSDFCDDSGYRCTSANRIGVPS